MQAGVFRIIGRSCRQSSPSIVFLSLICWRGLVVGEEGRNERNRLNIKEETLKQKGRE